MTNSEDSRKDVIFKVKKLLAMAEGKANLNEALAAAEIAQRLIMLHNIDEADLEASGNSRGSREEVYDYISKNNYPFLPTIQNPPDFIQILLKTIAEHNQCQIYVAKVQFKENEEPKEAFSIIGRQSAINLIEFLFFWLFFQIEKFFGESGVKDRRDFYFGVIAKLQHRLATSNDRTKGFIEKEKYENALVVINKINKEVKDIFDSLTGTFEEQDEVKANDGRSFAEGLKVGEKLLLEQQKELKESKLELLGSGDT